MPTRRNARAGCGIAILGLLSPLVMYLALDLWLTFFGEGIRVIQLATVLAICLVPAPLLIGLGLALRALADPD